MTLQDLKDKRHKLLKDAQTVLLGEGADSEKRAKANLMLADVDGLEADIASLERIAKADSEERARTTPPRGKPDGGIETADDTPETRAKREKQAFSNYIRYGRMTEENRSYLTAGSLSPADTPAELRDLTTGSTSVGYWIPQAFSPTLIEAQKDYGQVVSLVRTERVSDGAPAKVGLVNDTANGLTVLGEAIAVSETDPTLAGLIISTDTLTTGVVKVSLQSVQDSFFNVESFIKESFGKRYFRGLTGLITGGSSTGNVGSVVSGAHAAVTTASPTAIAYSEIAAMYAALDPAYVNNATWVLNSTTRGYLLGVTDSFGRPLYIMNPSADSFDMLIGRPVVLNQSMANIAATNVAIQFGDFKQGYLLRQVGDLAIMRLNERYMDTLEVGFIGYVRAGGAVTDGGTHPVLNLVQHA